jgi:pimeloyl-ACP methyl ester carboxylesterase
MTVTTKDGTQIYYKDWGSGPVITFSHGWPGRAARHHRNASGSDQRGTARLHRGATMRGGVTHVVVTEC